MAERNEISPILFNKLTRELQRKAIELSTGGKVNEPKEKTRKVRFSKLSSKDISFQF